MKLVLFDFDGTLIDSADLIHETMRRTFRQYGKTEPALDDTKSIIGLTLDIAISRLDGKPHVDDEAGEMTAYYKSLFSTVRTDLDFREPLFPGIREVLDELFSRSDILVGGVTGKSRRGLDFALDTHGFAPHFVVSRTADDCPSKPHPAMVNECCDVTGIAPADTLVIGDAVYDMQMAKAAGATAIGVSWGYAPVAGLLAAGADHIIDHPRALLGHLG
jgi:phosphoglycolate phosphatase